jgi:hypothetical protein
MWPKPRDDYGGIAKIGNPTEGDIAGRNEWIKDHIQPKKVAQRGRIRREEAQHQPRKQASSKLQTRTRCLNSNRM